MQNSEGGEQASRDKPPSKPNYSAKFQALIRQSQLEQSQALEHLNSTVLPPLPAMHPHEFYRVRSIGVGAHSFVYLVQEQATNTLYAQKSIVKAHAREHEEELLNQIKTLSFLNHLNIVKLYHVSTDESYVHLFLEYAQDSLFALKTRFTYFKEKEIVEILKQLLNGVRYMHHYSVVHADIKIENIMISNGTIKLCDFGYAHLHKQPYVPEESREEMVGTLEYLAPQYVQGNDSGWKRDIWAIGILAFQMLVGKSPFEGLTEGQKWAKLVKDSTNQYLQTIRELRLKLGIKSDLIEEFIRHTLCDAQERWNADSLLKLPMFQ